MDTSDPPSKNFGGGSSEVIVLFVKFRVTTGGITPLPHFIFSRNAPGRNFYMAICCLRNFKKGLCDWKLKLLVPILVVKSDWRVTNPLPQPSIPKTHLIKILKSALC
jgi:hypothetical protein